MNRLSVEKQTQVINCLVEGLSIRATVRMTGIAKKTVLKLLVDVGSACLKYQDKTLRNLPCKTIQADEIWSFVHAKEGHLPENLKGKFGYGDIWTFTAICADTKLVPCWTIGARTPSVYSAGDPMTPPRGEKMSMEERARENAALRAEIEALSLRLCQCSRLFQHHSTERCWNEWNDAEALKK